MFQINKNNKKDQQLLENIFHLTVRNKRDESNHRMIESEVLVSIYLNIFYGKGKLLSVCAQNIPTQKCIYSHFKILQSLL